MPACPARRRCQRALVATATPVHYGTNGRVNAERGQAVSKRAGKVPAEYAAHAMDIDVHCAGTQPGADGPVPRALRAQGIRGLSVGAFAEASVGAILRI